MNSFFLVVPLGIEKIALKELDYWVRKFSEENLSYQSVHGGIELEAPLELVLQLHFYLKVPSRILLRLEEFRCRDFHKLFKRVQKVNWNDYIGACDLNWKVSSQKSRVKIEKRIEETCGEAFEKYRKACSPKKDSGTGEFTAYVRFYEDQCVISLDLSGEHLHKRGLRRWTSEAPIRENLAAALLWTFFEEKKEVETEGIELVDPMVGSGTFLLEASQLFQKVKSREFAFQQSQKMRDLLSSIEEVFVLQPANKVFKKLVGRDISQQALGIAEKNLESVVEEVLLRNEDALCDEKVSEPEMQRWIILNPPYDHRIKVAHNQGGDFFVDLAKRLLERWKPQKMGIIVPEEQAQAFKAKVGRLKKLTLSSFVFSNGGLAVRFFLLEEEKFKRVN